MRPSAPGQVGFVAALTHMQSDGWFSKRGPAPPTSGASGLKPSCGFPALAEVTGSVSWVSTSAENHGWNRMSRAWEAGGGGPEDPQPMLAQHPSFCQLSVLWHSLSLCLVHPVLLLREVPLSLLLGD